MLVTITFRYGDGLRDDPEGRPIPTENPVFEFLCRICLAVEQGTQNPPPKSGPVRFRPRAVRSSPDLRGGSSILLKTCPRRFDLWFKRGYERAVLLDMQGSKAGLDDAIANLAAWMELAQDHLSEDDWAVLGESGGLLYREGASGRRP